MQQAPPLKIEEMVLSFTCHSDEAALNVISNTFTSHDNSTLHAVSQHCTFNPFDKVVELYEALLKSEREKIALLERMLNERK